MSGVVLIYSSFFDLIDEYPHGPNSKYKFLLAFFFLFFVLFHRFTGGFSAGYFNTVGSKEGWKPSQHKNQEQKLEDFMDEEDHANWGGTTGLRDDYRKSIPATRSISDNNTIDDEKCRSTSLPLKSIIDISHETVGPKLLKRLGWRESGTAIVPDDDGQRENKKQEDDDTLVNLTQIHLSRRRLRQIQLQSSIELPLPKLDQCGLGFEPYANAPEFHRYKQNRLQQAQDRSMYNAEGNVYRISDLTKRKSWNDSLLSSMHVERTSKDHSSEYLSYKTTDDRSHDAKQSSKDEAKKSWLNNLKRGEEYNTEVYDYESSGDESYSITTLRNPGGENKKNNQTVTKPNNNDVEGLFTAWSGTGNNMESTKAVNSSNVKPTALTSDGRPPLGGFVLGDSMDYSKRRYPGPDVPNNYAIKYHEFGENENPYILEAVSSAVQFELKEDRRSQFLEQKKSQPGDGRPISTSGNFSYLGEAMKLRFTSSVTEESASDSKSQSGLYRPHFVEKKEDIKKSISSDPNPTITISRTVKSFSPNPLVCKRFNVPLARNDTKKINLNTVEDGKDTEFKYFEREILNKVKYKQNQNDSKQAYIQNNSTENYKEDQNKVDRPSLEKLGNIFEPSSDECSDNSNEDFDTHSNGIPKKSAVNRMNDLKNTHEPSEHVQYQPTISRNDDNSSSESNDEASRTSFVRKRKKDKQRKSHHRKRKARKNNDDDNDDDHDHDHERRRDRIRRKQKKKKKKKSSSKRHGERTAEN